MSAKLMPAARTRSTEAPPGSGTSGAGASPARRPPRGRRPSRSARSTAARASRGTRTRPRARPPQPRHRANAFASRRRPSLTAGRASRARAPSRPRSRVASAPRACARSRGSRRAAGPAAPRARRAPTHRLRARDRVAGHVQEPRRGPSRPRAGGAASRRRRGQAELDLRLSELRVLGGRRGRRNRGRRLEAAAEAPAVDRDEHRLRDSSIGRRASGSRGPSPSSRTSSPRLGNSEMSAPATNARSPAPAERSTARRCPRPARRTQLSSSAITSALSAFTGGLSIVTIPTPPSRSTFTNSATRSPPTSAACGAAVEPDRLAVQHRVLDDVPRRAPRTRPARRGAAGTAPAAASAARISSGSAPSIGVSKMPGAIVHDADADAREVARDRQRHPRRRRAFDAAYATCPIWPSNAATEAVLTITPRSPSLGRLVLRSSRRGEPDHVERADEVDARPPREQRRGRAAAVPGRRRAPPSRCRRSSRRRGARRAASRAASTAAARCLVASRRPREAPAELAATASPRSASSRRSRPRARSPPAARGRRAEPGAPARDEERAPRRPPLRRGAGVFANCSRRAVLRNLPTAVFGISSTNSNRSGSHHFAKWGSRSSRSSSAVAVAPLLATTTASGRSPHFSSGIAITAASDTAACPIIWFSSATVEIHSPPDLMSPWASESRCRRAARS